MKKSDKGEWGYINYQRKRVMLITLVLYVCAIGIYLFGYITLKTTKSLWSILAVLSVLPASKSMVNLIMFLRFGSIDKNIYDEYSKAAGDVLTVYELAMTTYERTYYAEAASCRNNNLIICLKSKSGDKDKINSEIQSLEEHIRNVLANDGHKDTTVKVYDSVRGYCDRLEKMRDNLGEKNEEKDKSILRSLISVSL